jgi:hypothetical protein
MSRVEINAGGRHIIVDHDGTDLGYVVDKAEQLWKNAETLDPRPGPAYGFQAEKAPQWDHDRQRPTTA